MASNWVPIHARYFQLHQPRASVVTVVFIMEGELRHAGSVYYPIDELPGMLSRADVCQQIADKPLADRLTEFDYQWVGHCTAHVHHNRAFIGIVQKRMMDDVWFATSPHVGVPCETADQAARLLLAVHEVSQ